MRIFFFKKYKLRDLFVGLCVGVAHQFQCTLAQVAFAVDGHSDGAGRVRDQERQQDLEAQDTVLERALPRRHDAPYASRDATRVGSVPILQAKFGTGDVAHLKRQHDRETECHNQQRQLLARLPARETPSCACAGARSCARACAGGRARACVCVCVRA